MGEGGMGNKRYEGLSARILSPLRGKDGGGNKRYEETSTIKYTEWHA
jgi:hypothetical protein